MFCTSLTGSNQRSFASYEGNNPLKDHRKCLLALNFIRHLAANSVSTQHQLWIIIFQIFGKISFPSCASAQLHRTSCKFNASSYRQQYSFMSCGLLKAGGAFLSLWACHLLLHCPGKNLRGQAPGISGSLLLLSFSHTEQRAVGRADTAIQVSRLQGK